MDRVHQERAPYAREPWSASATAGTHRCDCAICQALASAARGYGMQWIRYPSARQLGRRCAAALTPECLSLPEPARLETGLCKVTAAQASMLHDEDRLTVALGG